MTYRQIDSSTIQNLKTGLFVPADPENRHYQEFQAWVADGNTPEPASPEPPATPPTPTEVLANLGLSPVGLLEVMAEAQKQRDAGLYPMKGADGQQIFANGAWQWVPAEKKDWVFGPDGQRITST